MPTPAAQASEPDQGRLEHHHLETASRSSNGPKAGTIKNARSFKAVMGIRVSEWARKKQLCPALVYSVVSGQRKCLRGASLQIAQELGMK